MQNKVFLILSDNFIKIFKSYLGALGFKTSLWTHPFINLECKEKHSTAKSKGYLVNSITNSVESVWWNGKASYIDFTNPEAANWWSSSLRDLLAKSGIDTLKFDAGEFSWYVFVYREFILIIRQRNLFERTRLFGSEHFLNNGYF